MNCIHDQERPKELDEYSGALSAAVVQRALRFAMLVDGLGSCRETARWLRIG